MPVPQKFDASVPIDAAPAQFSEDLSIDTGETPKSTAGTILNRYNKAVEPFTRIEAPNPRNRGKLSGEEAIRAVGNIGAGGLGVILHPLNTLESIGGIITAPAEMLAGSKFSETVPGQMVKSFKENPYGTIEAGIGQAGATAGLGKAAEGAVRTPAAITESLRSAMKRGTGASPLDIKDVAEEGAKKVQEHAEATQEAANEQKSREALEQSALRGKTEEIAKQQSAERLKAKAKDVAAQRQHQQAVGETKQENEAALRAQKKIPATREKLQKSVQELQGQIETARENALKEGNKKYSAVNEALNPIQADPEAVQGALMNATEALKGSHAEPTLIRSMMAKFERGDPWTYEDLQGDYSRLGKELSKGTLPGDEFHAYDVLHEAIGDEMQRIADSKGLGGQLKAARDYWRRMKQTFGRPYNPTDAANVTLEKTAGSVMRDAEQANRLRLLGSFDKSIPQTAEHIANLQKGLESLPKEAPTREVVKPLPERPTPAGSPKFEGTPEELARQAVKQPERPEYPNRPERVNLQERQAQQIMERGAKITNSPSANIIGHAMTGFGSTWALVEALRGQFSYAGSVLAARMLIGAGQRGLGALLRNESVANWLAKPTAADLEVINKLTPQQRAIFSDNFRPVVDEARSKGMPVDPRLAAIAHDAGKKVGSALRGLYTGEGGYLELPNGLADYLGRRAVETQRESAGNYTLETMQHENISPQSVSKDFWDNTYYNLPAEGQRYFQRYISNLWGGAKPGDVIGTAKDGSPIVAKDWMDMAEKVGLSSDPSMLEGIERGYVALMKEANDRFTSKVGSRPEGRGKTALHLTAGDILRQQ